MVKGTMEDETLEEILSKKYNIQEKLVAEGNFVALYGIDKEATQLTAAGISSTSFIIAAISLSGEQKDYDLISITSVSLIDLGIQSFTEKKMFVKSQFKSPQLYQLCSCEEQETVWMKFVKVIDSLQRRKNMHGDQWQTVPFETSIPLSGVGVQSADHEHALVASSMVDVYPWSRERSSSSSQSSVTRSASTISACAANEIRINLSRSSSSLPEKLTENFSLETGPRGSKRGQSVGSLDARCSGSSFQNNHKENLAKEREVNYFKKVESVECLEVSSTTSSVFSECESSLLVDLEVSSEQETVSLEEVHESLLDRLVSNSESNNEEEQDSFLNKSNNFLSQAERHRLVDANTVTEGDDNSVKSTGGFLRRLCRRWFCCKKK